MSGGPLAEIGIIGGSGLYEMAGFELAEQVKLATPFGDPSDEFTVGTLAGRRVAFLCRHGRGHRFSPSNINYRANLHGFKQLGVTRIFSASAVGSLKEKIAPLDLVVPDQFIDRTFGRAATFFDDGCAAHVAFADPFCPELRPLLAVAARATGARVHDGGIYLCMEGPAFSTRAESELYRGWGAAVVGMTNLTEAKLAREAELCYATLALATDYDCWRPGREAVTVEMIIANLRRSARAARDSLATAIAALPAAANCGCGNALATALVTDPAKIPAAARERLALIAGRYWPAR